jgi:Ca-activated chloride channel family protein
MRRLLPGLLALLVAAPAAHARGLLIPTEKKLPPLAMLNHQVKVAIDDQVAVTTVEQTFRNHTDRQLEATYVFPVPKGASVRKFSMWVDGKEVRGELVEADKARQIYTSIVQRTQDPGLLEYMGNNLLRLRVFPVPARGDQKIALSYTAVADAENGLIEYVYPLKTDGRAAQTLEKFSIKVDLKGQHALTNIYSPSHAITMTRPSDRRALITFEKDAAVLDRDFQLYYQAGGKDVGLTALAHRPIPGANGYFMLLLAPRAELSKSQQAPRDMVFVLDTSGSMRGKRMDQARNALKFCIDKLGPNDRFGLMNFATTVNKYNERLLSATQENLAQANKWVDDLEATGGTAINDALQAALSMRTADDARTFTIVFFTDGRPTIGETNAENILKNVAARNTSNTRIFTFGVGDDVNASMLDRLADQSRALSTYVRESEDITHKVGSLYAKISNPVLTNLKLAVGEGVKLSEVYPPQLPDLFHGTQLVVLGRYSGKGHVAIKLTGNVGKDAKEFVYEVAFPEKSGEDRTFVEDLWARRKVGYLLDQIRVNGEKKELVDEVVILAKRYGITTPYTSYLVVPDAPVPVASRPVPAPGMIPGGVDAPAAPPALLRAAGDSARPEGTKPHKLAEVVKKLKGNDKGEAGKGQPGEGKDTLGAFRGRFEDERMAKMSPSSSSAKGGGEGGAAKAAGKARDRKKTLEEARELLRRRELDGVQSGKLGVELSEQTSGLRRQNRVTQSAVRRVQDHNLLEVGGVWIDEAYDAKMKVVTVKAMSKAYFRILERHPDVRHVFRLGNHLVWVTPSNTALVIDTGDGVEQLADADIDRLFTVSKK